MVLYLVKRRLHLNMSHIIWPKLLVKPRHFCVFHNIISFWARTLRIMNFFFLGKSDGLSQHMQNVTGTNRNRVIFKRIVNKLWNNNVDNILLNYIYFEYFIFCGYVIKKINTRKFLNKMHLFLCLINI